MRNFSHHLHQMQKTWYKWVENNWDKRVKDTNVLIQQVGQAHKCAPERCGAGGKSSCISQEVTHPSWPHRWGGGDRGRGQFTKSEPQTSELRPALKGAAKHWCCFSHSAELKCVLKGDFHELWGTQPWNSTLNVSLHAEMPVLYSLNGNFFFFPLDSCFLLEQLPSFGHGFPSLWLIRMCDNRVLRSVVQKPWNKD